MLDGESTFVPNHSLDIKPEESKRAIGSIAYVASGKKKRAEPGVSRAVKAEPRSASDLVRALETLTLRERTASAASSSHVARCASCNGSSPVCAGPAGRNTLCRSCYDGIKRGEGSSSASPARSVRNATPVARRPVARRAAPFAAAPAPSAKDADGFAIPALPTRSSRNPAAAPGSAAESGKGPMTPRRSARLGKRRS